MEGRPRVIDNAGTAVLMLAGAEYQVPVLAMKDHSTEEMTRVMDGISSLPQA